MDFDLELNVGVLLGDMPGRSEKKLEDITAQDLQALVETGRADLVFRLGKLEGFNIEPNEAIAGLINGTEDECLQYLFCYHAAEARNIYESLTDVQKESVNQHLEFDGGSGSELDEDSDSNSDESYIVPRVQAGMGEAQIASVLESWVDLTVDGMKGLVNLMRDSAPILRELYSKDLPPLIAIRIESVLANIVPSIVDSSNDVEVLKGFFMNLPDNDHWLKAYVGTIARFESLPALYALDSNSIIESIYDKISAQEIPFPSEDFAKLYPDALARGYAPNVDSEAVIDFDPLKRRCDIEVKKSGAGFFQRMFSALTKFKPLSNQYDVVLRFLRTDYQGLVSQCSFSSHFPEKDHVGLLLELRRHALGSCAYWFNSVLLFAYAMMSIVASYLYYPAILPFACISVPHIIFFKEVREESDRQFEPKDDNGLNNLRSMTR